MKHVVVLVSWSVLLTWCLGGLARAHAPDAETLKAAEERVAVVDASAIGRLSHSLTTNMWPTIESQFVSKIDSATLSNLKAEFDKSTADFAVEAMEDAPEGYAKYFTVQELREMLAF